MSRIMKEYRCIYADHLFEQPGLGDRSVPHCPICGSDAIPLSDWEQISDVRREIAWLKRRHQTRGVRMVQYNDISKGYPQDLVILD